MAYCFLPARPFAFLFVVHPVPEAFVHEETMDRARPRNQTEDGPPTSFYRNLADISRKITLKEAAAASSALEDSDIEDDVNEEFGELEETDEEEHEDEEIEEDSDDGELLELDEIRLSTLARRLREENMKNVNWTRNRFTPPDVTFDDVSSEGENDIPTPLTYFFKYFPDSVFHELMEKTNMYSVHTSGRCIESSVQEIKKIVGAHILMGVVQYPRLRMYWSPATRIQFFDKLNLPRTRFLSLRNNLHIVDVNADHDQRDKLWKVRPIISSFENRCEQLELEENLCIDESIIPFKGQLLIKQYMKGKPNPWGVKVFMLCGASGIIYRSVVYQGSTTLPEDLVEGYSATNGLVIHLSKRIPNHRGHKLFCDNYFTSLLLLRELLERGIFSAGVIRNSRLQKCPLKSEKELQKLGRGTSDSLVTEDGKIVAVRWYDNKVVNVASNFVGVDPQDEVKRWDRKAGEYRMITRPSVIRYYNSSMGGVDKNDFLIALYRTFIRSKKWTLRVIFHYFNLAVCNSWLEYQRDLKKKGEIGKDLLQFTEEIAEGLAFSGYANVPKRGRPLSNSPNIMNTVPAKRLKPSLKPLNDIRYDNVGHWPIHEDGNEQRCKLESCGGRSRVQCEKCNVHLCLTKHRNCFKSFHCK